MTDLKTRVLRLTFPRSAERGPIEALRLSVSPIDIVAFPRSNERGLIEELTISLLGTLTFMRRIPDEQALLDGDLKSFDNCGMEISGHVQNGVVVFDERLALPEGAAVTVILHSGAVIRVAKQRKQVEFPLVSSGAPGSLHLTNERICEILDEEDAEAVRRSRSESS